MCVFSGGGGGNMAMYVQNQQLLEQSQRNEALMREQQREASAALAKQQAEFRQTQNDLLARIDKQNAAQLDADKAARQATVANMRIANEQARSPSLVQTGLSETAASTTTADANRTGRRSLRIDLATPSTVTGAGAVNIPRG